MYHAAMEPGRGPVKSIQKSVHSAPHFDFDKKKPSKRPFRRGVVSAFFMEWTEDFGSNLDGRVNLNEWTSHNVSQSGVYRP